MRTIEEMNTERARFMVEANALLDLADDEDRDLTVEEQKRFETLTAASGKVTAELALQNSRAPIFKSLQPNNELDDQPADEWNTNTRPSRRIVLPSHGKLSAFKNNARGREDAHTAGRFLAATLYRHGPSMRFCEQNGIRFDPMAALAGGVNTSGGALVPDVMGTQIIELMEQAGDFRANADNLPMTSDSLTVPRRVGGVSAFYSVEGQDGSAQESSASWDNVQFIAKKLMVLTRMSSEVNEDAIIDLGDRMTREIGLAMATKEDSVGFLGTGSAADGGQLGVLVMTLQAAFSKSKVAAASTHDTLGEITSTDLIKLMSMVPKFAKKGSKWYCSPTAQELIFNAIVVAAGGNSMSNLANMPSPVFLGYPMVISPIYPDDPAANYNGLPMVSFGNLMMAATVATRRQVRVAMSDQRYWSEDQIGIKGTLRHALVVHDLGSTTVKSPFCTLVGTT